MWLDRKLGKLSSIRDGNRMSQADPSKGPISVGQQIQPKIAPRRSVSNGRVTCSGNRDQLTWSDVLPADRFACASDAGSGFAFSSSIPVLPGPAQRAKHFAGLKIGEHRSPRCNQGARGRSNCSAQCANRNLDGGNRSGVSDSASVLLIDARYDLRGSAFVIDDTSALASDA